MAIGTVPFALQNASHSASVFRIAQSAPFLSGGTLSSIELPVSQQGTPNMSVILGPGRAQIVGTSVSPPSGQAWTTQAQYNAYNDANLTLTVAASNPTNPRIDAVYIQVQDAFYSGATNTAVAGIVTGTPAVSPTAPSVPSNAILIAYIAVAANATTIVTANLSYQASVAAVINTPPTFASIAARSAFFPTPAVGQQCFMSTSPLALMEYNGTGWQKHGLQKPSAAVATNGTATINDDGSVVCVFTAAGTLTLTNLFPALALTDITQVDWSWASSAIQSVTAKQAAGGTVDPATTGYDTYGLSVGQAGTSSAITNLNGTTWLLSNTASATDIEMEGTMVVRHITDPAKRTKITNTTDLTNTVGTTEAVQTLAHNHRVAAAWDGLQFSVSGAGTLILKSRPNP